MKLRTTSMTVATALLVLAFAHPGGAAAALPTYTPLLLDPPFAQATGRFAWDANTVGDLDGDGVNDVGVGAISEDVGGFTNVGQAYVFSGRTRALLRTFDNPEPQNEPFGNFGDSVLGIGDVNADGTPDLAIAAFRQDVEGPFDEVPGGCSAMPPPNTTCNQLQGKVYVFSGKTAAFLYAVNDPTPQAIATFGSQGLSSSDLDGDGFRDFVENAPFEDVGGRSRAGAAYAFSGRTGRLLYRFRNPDAPQDEGLFGSGMSNPGDVNGDGVDDPVIGAQGLFNGRGRAYLFNGKTGEVLRTLSNPAVANGGDGYGLTKGDGGRVGPGDVNGDGIRDIYVGAPGTPVGGTPGVGRAYLISGKDGSVIRVLNDPHPQENGSFGYNFATAGDINGDGAPEVLAMRFFGFATPAAYIFDPRTGAALVTMPGIRNDGPGNAVASPGDVNGDNCDDLFLGGWHINNQMGGVIAELSHAAAPGCVTAARRVSSQSPASTRAFAGCPAATTHVILGSPAANTITGTSGGDRVFAGAGDDTVDALAGDDCVDLGAGDDTGQGGIGDDLLRGDLGADRISAGTGDDTVSGGRGRDRLNGRAGKDRISGGRSADRIAGGTGNDRLSGNSGNDRLKGGSGGDRVAGGAGRDRIVGGSGRDKLSGGSGGDRIAARDGARDRISCGSGTDTVAADRKDRVARSCERVRYGR